jgi:hypothetical protein
MGDLPVRRRRPVCPVQRTVARSGGESAGWPRPAEGTQEPAGETQMAGRRRASRDHALIIKVPGHGPQIQHPRQWPRHGIRRDPPQQPWVADLQQQARARHAVAASRDPISHRRCARAAPHLHATDRPAPQTPRSSHSRRPHRASEPARPARQLGPQHQLAACPDSRSRPHHPRTGVSGHRHPRRQHNCQPRVGDRDL